MAKDPASVTVTINVTKNSSYIEPGSNLQKKLAASIQGGQAVDDYFKAIDDQNDQMQTLLNYITDNGDKAYEYTYDGQGNPMYVVNPSTGAATMSIRVDLNSDVRTDPATGAVYVGVAETHIASGDLQSQNVALMESSTAIADAGLAALTIAATLKSQMAASRVWVTETLTEYRQVQPQEVDLEDVSENASEGAREVSTVTETTEVAEATCCSVASVAAGVGAVLTVLGLIAIVMESLIKQMTHRFDVYNLTDLDLELEQPEPDSKDTTKFTLKPWSDQTDSIPKLWAVAPVEGTQIAYASTCTYAAVNKEAYRGLGYFIRIKPNGALTDGVAIVIAIPYSGKKAIWVGFDQPETTNWKDIYDAHSTGSSKTSFTAVFGDYTAYLSINSVDGADDQYKSTLTIVNTQKYSYLLG